jgi:hypothetical protein
MADACQAAPVEQVHTASIAAVVVEKIAEMYTLELADWVTE